MNTARQECGESQYKSVHFWIKRTYGKALTCVFCGNKKGKRCEWALRVGMNYEKNIQNFIQLCPICHRKYDYTEEMRSAQSDRLKYQLANGIKDNPNNNKGKFGGLHPTSKAICKIDITTKEIVKTYDFVRQVREDGYVPTTICAALVGRNKTSGGFIWKYLEFINL